MSVVVQGKSEGEAEGIAEDRHVKGKRVLPNNETLYHMFKKEKKKEKKKGGKKKKGQGGERISPAMELGCI